MKTLRIFVDHELRISEYDLPQEFIGELCDALTLTNQARISAEKHKNYGWQKIPKFIYMYKLSDGQLSIPRGFALHLKRVLRGYGYRVKWVDRRTWQRGEFLGDPINFDKFPYQPRAVKAIQKHQQGILKAPTGAGKTVICIGAVQAIRPELSLILVDKINLVDQWINRFHEHIGFDNIGRIGEGKWSEGPITVATLQTLHRKRDELIKSGWFNKFSFVLLDEMHHVTAETYSELLSLFPARFRLGVSATPDKTGDFEIALNVLGELFHETPRDEVEKVGRILKPKVVAVHTDFNHPFWPDHYTRYNDNCMVPNCKRVGTTHSHRNNFQQIKAALIRDADRNDLITGYLAQNKKHCQLVVTDQVKHIDELEKYVRSHDKIDPSSVFVLTGREKGQKRQEILRELEAREHFILLSTIADEALDIPKIDRVHLIFPSRNPQSVEQRIGRGTRTAPGKKDCIVYDYADSEVSVLSSQFRTRRWKCYEKLELEVIIVE